MPALPSCFSWHTHLLTHNGRSNAESLHGDTGSDCDVSTLSPKHTVFLSFFFFFFLFKFKKMHQDETLNTSSKQRPQRTATLSFNTARGLRGSQVARRRLEPPERWGGGARGGAAAAPRTAPPRRAGPGQPRPPGHPRGRRPLSPAAPGKSFPEPTRKNVLHSLGKLWWWAIFLFVVKVVSWIHQIL